MIHGTSASLVVAVSIALLSVAGPLQASEEPAPAGFRVFVDPETGEIVSAPAPTSIPRARQQLHVPPDDVIQESMAHPLGGVRARLGPRFRMNQRIHIDADGMVHHTCTPAD